MAVRNPTPEELRNLKNLDAEAAYRNTLATAMFIRLQKQYDVAAADGIAHTTHAFVQGKNPVVDAEGKPVCLTALEARNLSLKFRDRNEAAQNAQLALFELKRECGIELASEWDMKAKQWVFPYEDAPVSLPSEAPPSSGEVAQA